MALVHELTVGELYAWGSRRARLERIDRDSDGAAVAEIAFGRRFEHSTTLHARRWNPDLLPGLDHTWVEHKQLKEAERQQRQETERLGDEFRAALDAWGLRCYMNGPGGLTIHGDQGQLGVLLGSLQEAAAQVDRSSESALEALLG